MTRLLLHRITLQPLLLGALLLAHLHLMVSGKQCKQRCYTGGTRVCASNGVTYRNRCRFRNAQCRRPALIARYSGKCRKRGCQLWCSSRLFPVCANNGITYRNLCQLHNARCQNKQIRIYKIGTCRPCMKRSRSYKPVCGTNGITYRNLTELKRQQQCSDIDVEVLYTGVCRSCVRRCTTQKDNPVCGSDRRTYADACRLRNAQCVGKRVRLAYRGTCFVAKRRGIPRIKKLLISRPLVMRKAVVKKVRKVSVSDTSLAVRGSRKNADDGDESDESDGAIMPPIVMIEGTRKVILAPS